MFYATKLNLYVVEAPHIENVDLSSVVKKVRQICISISLMLQHTDYCLNMKQILEMLDLTEAGDYGRW